MQISLKNDSMFYLLNSRRLKHYSIANEVEMEIFNNKAVA